MRIFCFGNPHVAEDRVALDVGRILKRKLKKIDFIECGLDDRFLDECESGDKFIVLDVVKGIDKVRAVDASEFKISKTITAHDIDVGFYLKLLSKSGKEIKVIGNT